MLLRKEISQRLLVYWLLQNRSIRVFVMQCLWSVSGDERERNVLGSKNVGNGIDGFAAEIYVKQSSVELPVHPLLPLP